jgi:exodeoxyribonuclease V alpha subunit
MRASCKAAPYVFCSASRSGLGSPRIIHETDRGVDPIEQEVSIRFDDRLVKYDYGELDEVSLAYAVSIHKSQGSEFPAVVIPLAMQYYMLLQRNLIYTGITRGKRLLVLVGQRKALGIGGADSASCQTRMQTSDSVRQQTRCSTNLSGTTT